jgi:hypothetical protein
MVRNDQREKTVFGSPIGRCPLVLSIDQMAIMRGARAQWFHGQQKANVTAAVELLRSKTVATC